MVEIYDGALDVESIYNAWYNKYKSKNFGAFITFNGIVREENGINGLSFDIHEAMLNKWFMKWQEIVSKDDVILMMAHSRGDVLIHNSSYLAGVISPQRKIALKLINDFVEDFKARAPIWKYDLVGQKRVYAKKRSSLLPGAGILS